MGTDTLPFVDTLIWPRSDGLPDSVQESVRPAEDDDLVLGAPEMQDTGPPPAPLEWEMPAPGEGLTLVDTLGLGGSAVVHRAIQHALGREVAVKTLKDSLTSVAARSLLLREAWITGRLAHPGIVPVHDLQLTEDGRPRIVMKRVSGLTWGEVIGNPGTIEALAGPEAAADPLGWQLRVLEQVCQALEFAHSHGILHRDVKPPNIMLGRFGEVVLLDWGLAVRTKVDGDPRIPLSKANSPLCGTPCYAAPELMAKGVAATERTDVYLVGATLFEVLTGQPPHTGDTTEAVLDSVRRSQPVLPPGVPGELADIVRKAMQADPEARFGSVAELRLAVVEFSRHRGALELVSQAESRLAELQALLIDPVPLDRRRIYALHAECRFAYRQALKDWPECTDARAGLYRSTVAMLEYELGREDVDASQLLLDELEPANTELARKLSRLRDRQASQQERFERLEELERGLDPAVGGRSRAVFILILGGSWTLLPWLAEFLGETMLGAPGFAGFIGAGLVFMLSAGLFAAITWRTICRSTINRRIVGAIAVTMGVQVLFDAGCWAMGMDPIQSHSFHLLLWSLSVLLVGGAIHPGMWVSGLSYAAGFALVLARPDWLFEVISATNLVFTITSVWLWGHFKSTEDPAPL